MKRSIVLASVGFLFLTARAALAIPCDGVTTCERPDFNASTQSGWSISASGVSALKCLVSALATGNQVGSQYYFGVSNADLGATVANGGFTPGGPPPGARVISTAFQPNASQTPTSTVFGGSVQQILGNTAYFAYAQACPNGSVVYNSAGCSSWTRIGTATTSPYPTSVFAAPVAPGDATINTINYRTAVPLADVNNIGIVRLEVRDLLNAANNQTLADFGWPGNGTFPINNTMYTQNGGFKPNVKYEYRGQVTYPFGIFVPSTSQTRGPFWTTPATPANIVTANITHCSVQITANNSAGLPANPTYTPYHLCATGVCAANVGIGGTGVPGDTVSRTITGLSPNTTYTPNAQAIVGNGVDPTASSWNNSAVANGANFTTLNWGGTFSVNGITTNAAVFNVSGLIGAGSISSWQIRLNGSIVGQPSGAGAPPATINLTGLNPNTQYTVQIILTESSGCTSTLPTSAIAFTTTPNVPQTFSLSNPTAFTLTANWATNGNPGATVYQVQYCLDAAFTTGCATQNSTQGATSVQLSGLTANTLYFAHVKAVTVGGGLDSAYSNTASLSTNNNQSSITIAPLSASVATGNNQVFTATVVDANGNTLAGQAVNWTVSGGGNLSTANGASTTFTATTPGGPFTLTASLATYPNATAQITVVASGIQITLQPTLTLTSNNAGAVTTNATDNVLGNASINYTWTLESGPSPISVSPNGTNAAKNAVVTFSKAGAYVLRCTYSNTGGSIFATTPSTTVVQVLSGLTVSPSNITLKTIESQVFTASGVDQFGDSMSAPSVTWSTTGGSGNISGSGSQVSFSSPQLGSRITITARSGNLSGSANVSIISFDVTSAFAFPVPYKSTQGNFITFRGIGNDAKIRIYTTHGREVFHIAVQPSNGEYQWDVKNMSGERLASGVYFYVIESPDGKKDGKLIIIQ